MIIRFHFLFPALLLFLSVFAPISGAAHAYGVDPSVEDRFAATSMMATGPLSLIVFEGTGR